MWLGNSRGMVSESYSVALGLKRTTEAFATRCVEGLMWLCLALVATFVRMPCKCGRQGRAQMRFERKDANLELSIKGVQSYCAFQLGLVMHKYHKTMENLRALVKLQSRTMILSKRIIRSRDSNLSNSSLNSIQAVLPRVSYWCRRRRSLLHIPHFYTSLVIRQPRFDSGRNI